MYPITEDYTKYVPPVAVTLAIDIVKDADVPSVFPLASDVPSVFPLASDHLGDLDDFSSVFASGIIVTSLMQTTTPITVKKKRSPKLSNKNTVSTPVIMIPPVKVARRASIDKESMTDWLAIDTV